MNKIIILFTLLILVNFKTIKAQYDPDALKVLDAMSNKYRKTPSFQVTFLQRLINESVKMDEKISGTISVKNDKYVLTIAGQKIYNNGTDVYTYNEELKEVTVNKYQPEESEISIHNIYDLYKEGFKYALISIMSNGDRIIEMDPIRKDLSFFKVMMVINSKDQLKSFTIYERSGNKYVYTIDAFKSLALSDSYFTYDIESYPDVEVIDFR